MTTESTSSSSSSVRGQLLAVLVLLALAAGAVAFVLAGSNRPRKRHKPRPVSLSGQAAAEQQTLRTVCGKAVGADSAKVKVEAFLPVTIGCQDPVGLYLVAQARRAPSQLRVQISDMKDEKARARMDGFGVHCAAVVVNGKTRFDLGRHGGKLLLEGPMDIEDVCRVLGHELEQAYGDAAMKPSVPAGVDDE